MSETLRDLVVSLSLNSDNFTRNIKSINKQIQEAESAFRLASAGVENFETTTAGLSSKLSTLQRTFQLQQDAVGQYERALQQASDMCAIADKQLSSAVGFKGICKKVLILMLVGVAHIVDLHVVGTGDALRSAVVCFYLSNESVSMLENAAHLGLPIPEKLKSVLAQLHGRANQYPFHQ